MPPALKSTRKPTTRRTPAAPATGGEHVSFTTELWRWSGGAASWHFLTLPEKAAAWIRFLTGKERRGFGSVRVTATIGDTAWSTSVFPDAKSGSYLLPVKAQVRAAEKLQGGSTVKVRLDIAAPEPLQAARAVHPDRRSE